MANNVATIIRAPHEVIEAITDRKTISFNKIVPMPKKLASEEASFIDISAAFAAGIASHTVPHRRHLHCSALTLNDDSFEAFIRYLRNKREFGFFTPMCFMRSNWGVDSEPYWQNISKERISFRTSNYHPYKIISQLSKMFPNELIEVEYANEDIGRKCGSYTIKNGKVIKSREAPDEYGKDTIHILKKWRAFAFPIFDERSSPLDYDYDEDWNHIDDEENYGCIPEKQA
ncbi:hypothetical protein [Photobacterium kishitanii]|uniref:YubB ferredoxin-like domain-containing protein n=1 Tax=Photobacterium kishitanii TaxID=318456 RepID=A0A2T3KLZ0_9GAMM|nr:hypothetical protein [Photobacterium kishitanii]PSV00687.1 hypothetical protein C9J27_05980 [Photobacterium kishitanii]